MYKKLKQGISVVEVLIGVSILGVSLVFISYTITLFLNTSGSVLEKIQALYLAEEGHELLRYIRDDNWTTLATLTKGTTYYFDVSTTTILSTTTPEVIEDIYTRSFVLSEVQRDGNDDFVESGGTTDDGMRQVDVSVSWGATSTVALTSLLANLYDI